MSGYLLQVQSECITHNPVIYSHLIVEGTVITANQRLTALVLICTCLGALGCSKDTAEAEKIEPEVQDSVTITLVGHDSLSVLALLLQDHQVQLQKSKMGSFVEAIDGTAGGDGCYWIYSVNGENGQVAADECMPNDGDTVVWHFRKM